MDIRKEMSRSVFLAGGVTQLPGLVDRLTTEIDNLTPPAIRPKVNYFNIFYKLNLQANKQEFFNNLYFLYFNTINFFPIFNI